MAAHEPHFLSVQRRPDEEPGNSGQWGIALRYYAEELNDTEFGFYFANVHSRLPLITGDVATLAQMEQSLIAVAVGGSQDILDALQGSAAEAGEGGWPVGHRSLCQDSRVTSSSILKNLQTFGLSFNTALGTTGWAIQGEYSYHPDAPLQREEESLFTEASATRL